MYICCTAAATQIYSNVGGNLRQRHSAAVCAPQMQYIEIRDPERNEHILLKYTTEPCELSQKIID